MKWRGGWGVCVCVGGGGCVCEGGWLDLHGGEGGWCVCVCGGVWEKRGGVVRGERGGSWVVGMVLKVEDG